MDNEKQIKILLNQFFELLHVIEINDYDIKRDDLFEISKNYVNSKELMQACNNMKIDVD